MLPKTAWKLPRSSDDVRRRRSSGRSSAWRWTTTCPLHRSLTISCAPSRDGSRGASRDPVEHSEDTGGPDRMGCHNLDSEHAGLCPRGGETAIDDFSVGHNFPIPVAGRTVPGDPIRKCAFLSHDDESRRSGLILPIRFPGMSVSVPCSLRRVPTNPVQRPGPSRLSWRVGGAYAIRALSDLGLGIVSGGV
jgi:hypothetical protein